MLANTQKTQSVFWQRHSRCIEVAVARRAENVKRFTLDLLLAGARARLATKVTSDNKKLFILFWQILAVGLHARANRARALIGLFLQAQNNYFCACSIKGVFNKYPFNPKLNTCNNSRACNPKSSTDKVKKTTIRTRH